ncbi:hypothetical protein LC612_21635 [Nostoc sp. CHAB 5834]|nr:hypothetical protein [Nostoc sp. CHAB 5834]
MDALIINFAPVLQITDDQFFQLCQINELIRFERNADGTVDWQGSKRLKYTMQRLI